MPRYGSVAPNDAPRAMSSSAVSDICAVRRPAMGTLRSWAAAHSAAPISWRGDSTHATGGADARSTSPPFHDLQTSSTMRGKAEQERSEC